MYQIKKTAVKAGNFVARHKGAIVAGTVTIMAVVWVDGNSKRFGEFLETKGIDPMEYFYPEYYVEKTS